MAWHVHKGIQDIFLSFEKEQDDQHTSIVGIMPPRIVSRAASASNGPDPDLAAPLREAVFKPLHQLPHPVGDLVVALLQGETFEHGSVEDRGQAELVDDLAHVRNHLVLRVERVAPVGVAVVDEEPELAELRAGSDQPDVAANLLPRHPLAGKVGQVEGADVGECLVPGQHLGEAIQSVGLGGPVRRRDREPALLQVDLAAFRVDLLVDPEQWRTGLRPVCHVAGLQDHLVYLESNLDGDR